MPKTTKAKSFTIGRERFQKISAMEGVYLSDGMQEDFREFDRRELAPAERRRALVKKYGPKP
jgi:hypothetical protein